MQYTIEDCEKQIDEDEVLIHQMNQLKQNEGFKKLRIFTDMQERLRRNEALLGDYKGLDGLIERDKIVSELKGISTAMNLPDMLIQESTLRIQGCKEHIEMLKEERQHG